MTDILREVIIVCLAVGFVISFFVVCFATDIILEKRQAKKDRISCGIPETPGDWEHFDWWMS